MKDGRINKRTRAYRLLCCLFIFHLFILHPVSSHAANVKVYFSSGTGFFISSDGYLLTNLHVVNNCQKLAVAGPSVRPPLPAQIIARDPDHDLALLKVNVMGVDHAKFNSEKRPPQAGDRVVVVGYPGDAGINGRTVTREAKIVATAGPKGEEKWIQLDDVLEEGNSGGPLLDTAGNVVGIVAAKAVIYTYLKDRPQEGTTTHSGMAVSLKTIETFLGIQRMQFRSSDSGIYLSASRITDMTERYLVNVRCEYKTEVR